MDFIFEFEGLLDAFSYVFVLGSLYLVYYVITHYPQNILLIVLSVFAAVSLTVLRIVWCIMDSKPVL